jgi:hypothetical protein
MKNFFFFLVLVVAPFSPLWSEVTNSDRLFKKATDFVKEKKYSEAVFIFEQLARNNEHDAQYNLAFLISSGKGITKNYEEALFWSFLSMLGKIEKGEDLSEELSDIVPEKVLKDVREQVLAHLISRFEQKDVDVLMQLGDYYLRISEEKDFENAYLWFNVASAVGIDNASTKRDMVEKELEPDTIIKTQLVSRDKHEEFIADDMPVDKRTNQNTENEYES